MSESEHPERRTDEEEGKQPFPSPGPGHPVDETLPAGSVPAGEAELSKKDVGFGPTDEDEEQSESGFESR
jgi:hypothetical protein